MGAKGTVRAERLRQVREWKASGLSRDEFAAQVGLSAKTLGWWAWKLKAEGEQVCGAADTQDRDEHPEPELQFIELEPMTSPNTGLELEFDGITVRVPDRFESTTLKRVLDVLESRR